MSHYRIKDRFGTPFTKFIIENEYDWLYSRGGRTWGDVFEDEKGKYVWMHNQSKVYIPSRYA